MNTLLVVVRFAHMLAAILLFGGLVFAVVVMPPAMRADAHGGAVEWSRLMNRLRVIAHTSLGVCIVSGALWLVLEAALVSGLPIGDAMSGETLGRLATQTAFGRAWGWRFVLAFALVFVLIYNARAAAPRRRWVSIGGMLLAALYLATLAFAGHAAAGQGADRYVRVGADAAHALAAGAWLGSLPGLVLLLTGARRSGAVASIDVAAHAVRRFSSLGIASVGVLIVSGLVNAWLLVDDFPHLIGTRYGRLLMTKIALFLAMLALASVNRLRLTPRIAGRDFAAVRALARNASLETATGIAVVAIVAVLGVTVPAAHQQAIWPLAFTLRFETDWPYVVVAPAYPTTYATSPVRYTTRAIAQGAALFAENCAQCHGAHGHGDGPLAGALTNKPADLVMHAQHHSAGDMFWWIVHGVAGTPMPPFDTRLSETSIWTLTQFLRAQSAATEAASLTRRVDPWRPLVAPDFTFELTLQGQETLSDQRRRHAVLLVLYSLPQSWSRLSTLAADERRFAKSGLRVIAVPLVGSAPVGGSPLPGLQAIAALADPDVGATYAMFATSDMGAARGVAPAHVEFLIDRQGYLRARWLGVPDDDAKQTAEILGDLAVLKEEHPRNAAVEAHAH